MSSHDEIAKYTFKTTTRVRMSQTDIIGIVNNIRYFDFIEIGRFEYFRDMGLQFNELRGYGISMALLEVACRYISPLYFDELIDIHTRTEYLGDSSFQLKYLIVAQERDTVVAEGRSVSVCLDPDTRQPKKMPDKLKTMILSYEGTEHIRTKNDTTE
jgi:acyl-CoA thioester hydrolase